MLQQAIALVLPLILWGAVSGVLNLILTRKSQIEAWVNANPRLAAWSKFLRSVGFDPWALHAWATLLVSKKLPAAQQADSDVAKIEQAKADEKARRQGPPDDPDTTVSIMPEPVKLVAQDRSRLHNDRPDEPAECRSWRYPDWRLQLVSGVLLACALSCSSWKPVARTTNDVARVLCGEFFGEKQGIDFEQAAKKFCETRDDLEPWIDAVLAAKREAAPKAAALHP